MKVLLNYVMKELISFQNYLMALLIGIIINFFQGMEIFGSAVPFVVPVMVQTISKALVKFKNHKNMLLIKLPLERKDPAFVIDRTGKMVAFEGLTRNYFKMKNIEHWADLFEDDLKLIHRFLTLPRSGEIFYESLYSRKTDKYYKVNVKADSISNYLLVWLDEITVSVEPFDGDSRLN
ncbi:MAG: hypothetical protein KFF73_10390 [Cyclobacteriaceae bacterium]|nr:hypothetical protein [Cyclobacteriaceae bacterium]